MGQRTIELSYLNASDRQGFLFSLSGIFENAPWVAERVEAGRPFATIAALHEAMMDVVRAADAEDQLALLNGHPELAGKSARTGRVAPASRLEQGAVGLDRLAGEELLRFEQLNAAYRRRFAFPFIICTRRHTLDSILVNFQRRLDHAPELELGKALEEIGHITRLRLVERVDGPGKPKTAGRLSTHVLDTVAGKPAAGVEIVLTQRGRRRHQLRVALTNADGRTEPPLIDGAPVPIGAYEIAFRVGGYFAARGTTTSDPPFLDVIPIRFAVAEPEGHYHVPLLVSPWSYATYRGS
jgi:2-oxo-4-hydroxy-4-carboxy-5-ureidoimidazoline decarboxylase